VGGLGRQMRATVTPHSALGMAFSASPLGSAGIQPAKIMKRRATNSKGLSFLFSFLSVFF
jgi:hypothetical protein